MSEADITYNKNEDANKLLWAQINKKIEHAAQGGGHSRLEKIRSQGKMTARERIEALLDIDKPQFEVGALAGTDMYEEEGGCPSAGVVVIIGYIKNRLCIVVANDASVKAGAWFPITGKKNLRAQEIAMENKIPIIYLVDSAGIYLPLQGEIFADKEHFGRIFRNNAKMSSMGIPQIAAVMGSCVAGGAYLPIMSDEALIVEGSGSIFLAGPYLVKAAIGEDVDSETLGGATTHAEISGVTDYKLPNDKACLDKIRDLIGLIGAQPKAGIDRIKSVKPSASENDLFGIFPEKGLKPYDMRTLLEAIIDANSFNEYKAEYGQTIVCGYARIDGWAVGIVANQRLITKNGKGEMQFGGVIYSDSADKATRFIMNCNQKKVPLVFVHDVTGFMVGTRSEHGGIIKDGAKMVNAVANSTVPKFTVVVGNSFGAGNYAMCGKAYDPRLIIAWPSAKIAVMGGNQAASVLAQIQIYSQKAKGKIYSKEEEINLVDEIKLRYEEQTSPTYAAARLWVDAVIDPRKTRQILSMGIEMADHAQIEQFNVGVIQT
ncbi:MAG TPA: carboxyl transferase domain-containing protein [Saprospiraceae bacterium]|nr:carboxyl transferase domain-containing protein [Saprospiraceae bacterium]HPN69325.1 carboxyl transferase domain-containing protein [Saprospiraceae bacterium]